MAKGNSSSRSKKSHSSKPYDVSHSFVKKVTSQVTNLLPQSSWLSKWLSPVTPNNAVNQQDTESDDDDDDVEIVQPPPSKRAKIPLNRSFPANSFRVSNEAVTGLREQQPHIETSTPIQNAFTEAVAGPSGLGSSPRFATPSAYQSSSVHTENLEGKLNGDGGSDSSESTSGCSSLVPQADRQIQGESLAARRRNIDEKLNLTNHLQSARSLFPNRTRAPRTSPAINRRRPSFNVSAFGSPLLEAERLPSKDLSPFYSGRTMYGGASAYRRPREGMLVNELNISKRGIQVRPMNDSKDSADASMSHTARRILEALEQFSTPVQDAKRMPLTCPAYRPPLGSKRKWPVNETLPTRRPGPTTQQLTIPTVPDLLKLRRREKLQDSMESARRIASSSAHTVEPYNIRCEEDPKGMKHGGKVSKANPLDEGPVSQVNLPNIALPITTLPKFDFTVPPLSMTLKSTEFRKNNSFKFSPPITVTNTSRSVSSQGNFTFSLPLNNSATGQKVTENFIPSCPSMSAGSLSTTPTRKEGNNSVGGKVVVPKNNGQANALGFEIKTATELKTGSVMDILKGKDDNIKSASASFVGFGTAFKPAPDTWECGECLIRNQASASVCVACTNPRVKAKASAPPASQSGAMWKCPCCLVQNKDGEISCVTCTMARPGSVMSPAQTKAKETNSAPWTCVACQARNPASNKECKDCWCKKPDESAATPKITSSESSATDKHMEKLWKCPLCFVSNEKNAMNCSACHKPNASIVPPPPPPCIGTTKFNFAIPPEAGKFKFGVDKSGNQPVPSDTVKGFKFGDAAVTTSAVNFSFGVPASGSKTSDVIPVATSVAATPLGNTGTTSLFAKPSPKLDISKIGEFTFGNIRPQNADSTSKSPVAESKKRPASDMLDTSSNIKGSRSDNLAGSSVQMRRPEKKPERAAGPVENSNGVPSAHSEPAGSAKGSADKPGPPTNTIIPAAPNLFSIAVTSSLSPTAGTSNAPKSITTTSNTGNFSFASSPPVSTPSTISLAFGAPSQTSPANFTFGSSALKKSEESSTQKKQAIIFGSTPPPMPNFNTSVTTSSGFGSGASATSTAASTFGAPSTTALTLGTTTTKSTVGSPAASITPCFGAPATTTPIFGTTTTKPSFGAPATKTLGFGTPATTAPGFGTPVTTAPGFGTPVTTAPGFGTPVTTAPGFGTPVTTAPGFGTPVTTAPGFGTPVTTAPGFGTPVTTAPGFGTPVTTATPGLGAPATTTPGFGSHTKTTPGFGAPATTTPGFGAPATTTPGFGAPATTTPGFGAPATTTPGFGAPATTAPGFGATAMSGFGTPATKTPSFGAPTTVNFGTPTAAPSFGTPATSAPSFGTQAITAPGFGTPASAATSFGTPSTAAPSFGTLATTTASFVVPANTTPSFGASTTTSGFGTSFGSASTPAFGGGFSSTGAAKSTTPNVTPSTFVFGSRASSSTPNTSFSFSNSQPGSTGGECPPAKVPNFGFGTSGAGVSNAALATAPAPNFGSVFSAGSTPAPSVFGANASGATPSSNPVFGAAPTPGFGTNASGNLGSHAFNFNAGSSQPFSFTSSQHSQNPAPTYAFGQPAQQAQPAGPPTFNPNARPSFDFTGGETPQFTAVPSPAPPPSGRRIKKAVRRTAR